MLFMTMEAFQFLNFPMEEGTDKCWSFLNLDVHENHITWWAFKNYRFLRTMPDLSIWKFQRIGPKLYFLNSFIVDFDTAGL